MKEYNETKMVFMPGEHKVLLPSGTKVLGYEVVEVNCGEKPLEIIQDENYLNYVGYDLYVNNVDVIVDKIRQKAPGVSKIIFEQEQGDVVIFAPGTHKIYLPQNYDDLLEGVYEAESDEFYRLYRNGVIVEVSLNSLDESTPGKPLVKR